MEQGPTEPHAGRSTFLLSSGGAWGDITWVAFGTGPIPTEQQFLWSTLAACLIHPPCLCALSQPPQLPLQHFPSQSFGPSVNVLGFRIAALLLTPSESSKSSTAVHRRRGCSEHPPHPTVWESLDMKPASPGWGVGATRTDCCNCEQSVALLSPHQYPRPGTRDAMLDTPWTR